MGAVRQRSDRGGSSWYGSRSRRMEVGDRRQVPLDLAGAITVTVGLASGLRHCRHRHPFVGFAGNDRRARRRRNAVGGVRRHRGSSPATRWYRSECSGSAACRHPTGSRCPSVRLCSACFSSCRSICSRSMTTAPSRAVRLPARRAGHPDRGPGRYPPCRPIGVARRNWSLAYCWPRPACLWMSQGQRRRRLPRPRAGAFAARGCGPGALLCAHDGVGDGRAWHPHEAGLASGLINTSRQIGRAVGLAVMGTVAANAASQNNGTVGSIASALTNGYDRAFLIGACALLVAGGLALLLPGKSRVAARYEAPATVQAEPEAADLSEGERVWVPSEA